MQFYPQEKDTRPVPPWPKDYDTTVAEMKLPLLLASTFTDDTRASTVTKKTCLLCGWTYYNRPIRCRDTWGWHLLPTPTMCICASHFQSTFSVMHRLSRSWSRGTNTTRYKTERRSRDRCRVGNLTIRWTWNCLAKRLVLLAHWRRSGQGRRWTSNGPEVPCRLDFPWAFGRYPFVYFKISSSNLCNLNMLFPGIQ